MAPDPDTCQHRWHIKPANGPWSEGYCRRCHERKLFSNSALEASAFTNLSGKRGRPKKEEKEL